MSSGKITIDINKDTFSDFVDKLQDLTSISDVIKLKIDADNIMAYSMLSNDVSVLALKNYSLSTSEYISNFKSEKVFDFIITGASKFVKNLKFFNTQLPIKMDMDYKSNPDDENIMHVRASRFSNGKLKISCIGGELSKIRDINKSTLDSRLNPKSSKWGFNVNKSDFSDVKRLSSINSEDKVLTVLVTNGKVQMMEDYKWELEVDQIDSNKNTKIVFSKKYLSNINDENENIDFKIFETFILVSDNNSNLMLSFETNFENDQD